MKYEIQNPYAAPDYCDFQGAALTKTLSKVFSAMLRAPGFMIGFSVRLKKLLKLAFPGREHAVAPIGLSLKHRSRSTQLNSVTTARCVGRDWSWCQPQRCVIRACTVSLAKSMPSLHDGQIGTVALSRASAVRISTRCRPIVRILRQGAGAPCSEHAMGPRPTVLEGKRADNAAADV